MARRKANPERAPDSGGEKVTYILEQRTGEPKRVKVPKNWHVTFGPIAPSVKASDGPAATTGGVCLRFYDGEVQKACFTGVQEFRILEEMEIEERVTLRDEQILQRDDFMGGQAFRATAERFEWRNPDELKVPLSSAPKMLEHAKRAADEVFNPAPARESGGKSR